MRETHKSVNIYALNSIISSLILSITVAQNESGRTFIFPLKRVNFEIDSPDKDKYWNGIGYRLSFNVLTFLLHFQPFLSSSQN